MGGALSHPSPVSFLLLSLASITSWTPSSSLPLLFMSLYAWPQSASFVVSALSLLGCELHRDKAVFLPGLVT